MPSIVWIAIALAIILIGAGTAYSVPEAAVTAAMPLAEGSGQALTVSGYGIAAGIVIFAIIVGISWYRRPK